MQKMAILFVSSLKPVVLIQLHGLLQLIIFRVEQNLPRLQLQQMLLKGYSGKILPQDMTDLLLQEVPVQQILLQEVLHLLQHLQGSMSTVLSKHLIEKLLKGE